MGTAMGAAVFGALLGPVVGAAASVVGVRGTFSAVAALEAVLLVAARVWSRRRPSASRSDWSWRRSATATSCSGSG